MKVCPKCGTQYPGDANFCPVDAGRLITADESSGTLPAAPAEIGEPVEPTNIGEQFELGDRLGGGLTGDVFRALDRQRGRACAIKLVAPAVLSPPHLGLMQRAERELKQLERLDSPGIARVLAHGKDGEQLWVATELVSECRSAHELVADDGPLEITRASRIVLEVGKTLTEAARLGVIHRDVAPKNILVLPDDTVKVINFCVPVPTSDKVHGVPEFVAPEQVEGKPVDQRSTIYSLGAVFYYLVAGRPPYQGQAGELFAQHVSGTPQAPSEHVPVPDAVDAVVLRALERSASKRYMTLRQFLSAIEPFTEGNFDLSSNPGAAGGKGKKRKLADTLLDGYGLAKAAAQDVGVGESQASLNASGVASGAEPAAQPDAGTAGAIVSGHTLQMGAVPAAAASNAGSGAAAPASASSSIRGQARTSAQSMQIMGSIAASDRPESGRYQSDARSSTAAAADSQAEAPGGRAGEHGSQPGTAQAEPAARAPAPTMVARRGGSSLPGEGERGHDKHSTRSSGAAEVAISGVPGAAPSEASDAADSEPMPVSGETPEQRKKRKAESKAKFRETLWFKKGELDAAAAAAAEDEKKRTGRDAMDKADFMPMEDRYVDDGSVTAGDKAKFSLKTGGTEAMPAFRDKPSPASSVTERELIDELQQGRGKIIAIIIAAMLFLGAVVAFTIHTYGGSEPATEDKGSKPKVPVLPPE